MSQRTMALCVRALLGAGLLVAPLATSAFAQAKPRPRGAPKWMLEIHGGAMIGQGPTKGSGITDFPVGPVFQTSFPDEIPVGPTSRAVSTWFFGDGTALFNQMQAQSPVPPQLAFSTITPLDGLLRSSAARRRGGPTFGVRVTRALSTRYGIELGFERTNRNFAMTDEAETAIEATRSSFERAFGGLLAVIPQINGRATATAQFADETGQETTLSGALVMTLTSSSRIAVQVLGGGGVIFNHSSPVQLRLQGNYRFTAFDGGQPNESDTVTVTITDRDRVNAGIVGGAFEYRFGGRQGLRFDVRAFISPNGIITTATAVPSVATSSPGVVATRTDPTIVISSRPGTRTTLSGGTIAELETFTGSGLDVRMHVTAGYFFRF